ncbi:MAG: bifunctional (p)ppGpp synthetase/guanosine-3',5'-bis(diphosphate) 3'-pyrophosphohydrolase [Lachnospiraceae bacterium]|nr:bifunctional (p)ppGpp synthetase/guanosine-3',5'-bis(diphosphate) 3'-pyrophosphohydrolase [Lachnospiraceae bacterium]
MDTEQTIENKMEEVLKNNQHLVGGANVGKKKEKTLSTPADFTPPDELYHDLIDHILQYHPSTDISMIEKAYHIASEAHKDQKRKSGEPYIIHPLCVAIILAELEMDKETIVAGILHDVVEDTVMTADEIAKEFSPEVALLVEGVTKLTKLNFSQDKLELQAENLRKMFLAMAKDIRVIIIKLADRLHNLRTMQYQSPQKQIEKSRETMDIYAPIAHRLGISKIKVELDDLSLKYLMPEVYEDLTRQINERITEREAFIASIVQDVQKHIDNANIPAEIDGRVKHFFSIYKKMVNQHKTLDQIYDIFAVRIKVETVRDCYAALGVIHEMYTPIPGRFKDYIAMPKSNMYQSLHTTLIGPSGQPFEIQIRTFDMHRTAEYGIAAHWKYKENMQGSTGEEKEEAKLAWLRQILEWQQETDDNKEFMSAIKTDLDLFAEQVYCFTPAGDVKNLPSGSTPIDFAYSIHTAVGNRMIGARVNGRQVTIDYKLQNGDRVEILTAQNAKGPSRDWLNIVKSTQAKTKINQWFRQEYKEDNITRGKELLNSYCKTKGIQLSDYTKPEYIARVTEKYNFRDWESVCAAIGHGGLKEGQVMNRLVEEYERDHCKQVSDEEILSQMSPEGAEVVHRPRHSKGGIIVKGIDDVAVHFSKCCSPVPGDKIVGYVTRGRGVSIHRSDCINVLGMTEEEKERLIEAEWQKQDNDQDAMYVTDIKIYAIDRRNIVFDVSKVFTEMLINVTSMTLRTNRQGKATINVAFEIRGVDQLNKVIAKIRNIDDIIDIERTMG